MTFERSTKPPNARTSAISNPPRWSTKSEQKPASGKPSTPTTQTTLRREAQVIGASVHMAENKGDGATPVKAFMSSNITPRSGSRKARVESASSTPRMTPESTPPIARPTSMIEAREWTSGGPKTARGFGAKGDPLRHTRAQSVVSDVQYPTGFISADGRGERVSRTASPDTLPKFFHANEAKPNGMRPQSQSPRIQPRLAGLKHINGASTVDASTPSPSPDAGDERPKFFHADGSQPTNTSTPRLANGPFSARPPLQTIFSSYQTTNSPVQRPPSPLKEELVSISRKSSLNKPSPRRHTRLVSRGSNDIRAPESLINGQSNLSRRSSLNDSAKRNSQTQSPTTARFEYTSSRRSSIALSDSGRKPPPMIPPESTSPQVSPTEPTGATSPEPQSVDSPSRPAPGQSKLDHLNELAANARRERKVLDLEISNSSLLAINRTLEAEMRKQKAELRHLRRLRSSGRFPSSARSGSSRFSMPSTSDDLSPTSSADEDDEGDDDRFSNISSGTSDGTSFPDSLSFSPTLRNSSMIPVSKGRQSRPHRLDLSAQRTLLQDSQKLNQALKRCLGRTDELIADGKKALEYKVDTNDLAVPGPRVLAPEDRDDGGLELGRGLLSPGLEERGENPWERIGESKEDLGSLQLENLEGLMLDLDEYDGQGQGRGQGQEGDGRSKYVEQDIPSTSPQTNTEIPPGDLDTHSPEKSQPPNLPQPQPQDPTSPTTPTTPHEQGDIPYEDPGIDTGSETSPLDLDEAQANYPIEVRESNPESIDQRKISPGSITDSASEGEVEPEIEPSTSPSSPGKSLGNFLRMVGGSWGV